MDMISNELPLDYLKYLYKYYDSNKIFEINGNKVFEDTNSCLYSNEEFKKHPSIPGMNVSNYGRIATIDYEIIKQEIGSNDYLYIECAIPIDEIERDFNKENKIKIKTPLFLDIFEEDKYGNIEIRENIYEYEQRDEHPYFWLFKQNNKLFTLGNRKRYYINPIKAKNRAGEPRQIIILPICVYRLVAETWVINEDPENKKEVHYIINNGYNNTPYNLMWVNKNQHGLIEKNNSSLSVYDRFEVVE